MSRVKRIIILRTKAEPFEKFPYVIHLLSQKWREEGIRVEVTDSLPPTIDPEVLVIPHLDVTVIPVESADLLKRWPHVINRSVMDISKREISRQLVNSAEDYDGPVIVKTNRNFGGLPEARAARAEPARDQQPWLHWMQYCVHDHPRLVAPAVWDDPLLVVEKFLPEMEDGLYCLRQYVFLGLKQVNTRSVSPNPIVKAWNVVRREILDSEPPPGVRKIREQLGFDFGKFDYVMHGENAIVFDVNKTPSYNPRSKAGSANSMIADLAGGIHSFLDCA